MGDDAGWPHHDITVTSCAVGLCYFTLQMDIGGGVTNFRRRLLSFEINTLSNR